MASISLVEKDPIVDLAEGSLEVEQSPPRKRHRREAIIMGQELSDVDINLAQHLLKAQLNGLKSTLLQDKKAADAKSTTTDNLLSRKAPLDHCDNCKLLNRGSDSF